MDRRGDKGQQSFTQQEEGGQSGVDSQLLPMGAVSGMAPAPSSPKMGPSSPGSLDDVPQTTTLSQITSVATNGGILPIAPAEHGQAPIPPDAQEERKGVWLATGFPWFPLALLRPPLRSFSSQTHLILSFHFTSAPL